MRKRILVAYATRSGSTRGVAEAIGENLTHAGARADVIPMKYAHDVASYHAVVAGSAILGGKWLPEAMRFMVKHQSTLALKPFAAFLVCMSLAVEGSDRGHVASWLAPVRARVEPLSEGLFAGALNVASIHHARNRTGLLQNDFVGAWPEGDYRDWGAINAWADSLHPLLLREAPSVFSMVMSYLHSAGEGSSIERAGAVIRSLDGRPYPPSIAGSGGQAQVPEP